MKTKDELQREQKNLEYQIKVVNDLNQQKQITLYRGSIQLDLDNNPSLRLCKINPNSVIVLGELKSLTYDGTRCSFDEARMKD